MESVESIGITSCYKQRVTLNTGLEIVPGRMVRILQKTIGRTSCRTDNTYAQFQFRVELTKLQYLYTNTGNFHCARRMIDNDLYTYVSGCWRMWSSTFEQGETSRLVFPPLPTMRVTAIPTGSALDVGFSRHFVSMAHGGPVSAFRSGPPAAGGVGRGREDLLQGELQGQPRLEARKASGPASAPSSREGKSSRSLVRAGARDHGDRSWRKEAGAGGRLSRRRSGRVAGRHWERRSACAPTAGAGFRRVARESEAPHVVIKNPLKREKYPKVRPNPQLDPEDGKLSLARVNALHLQLKTFVNRLARGVSTRHLQGYLNWTESVRKSLLTDCQVVFATRASRRVGNSLTQRRE